MATEFYEMRSEEALRTLGVTKHGLSVKEAQARLAKYGHNKIVHKKRTHPLVIFAKQFASVLVGILIFATAFSAIIGMFLDAAVIFAIIILNAVLGFVQEYRAERAIEALEKLSVPKAIVIRAGKRVEISSDELVPGDVVELQTGSKVPADCRLIESYNLKADESLLTGESIPTEKNVDSIAKIVPLAERKNCVFSNTVIVHGKCLAVVFATGKSTEVGKIAELITEAKEKVTPLQQKLSLLGRTLGALIVLITAVVFVMGVLRGIGVMDMLLNAISLAVAAVPEGLVAVVTITLSLGVKIMAKNKAIVRHLPAVETLGSCDFICADKTGTITKNQMTVQELFVNEKILQVTGEGYDTKGDFLLEGKKFDPLSDLHASMLLRIAALNNNASLINAEIAGDPTEGALLVLAAKAQTTRERLEKIYHKVGELSFDAKRKRMSTIHKKDNQIFVFTKGAPDLLVQRCSHILKKGKVVKLSIREKEDILRKNEELARKALRVLGFAYKILPNLPKKLSEENIEADLVFVGLAGMMDPPRPEAVEAIKEAHSAGVKVAMITGDHRLTALAIARQVGLANADAVVLEGLELDSMSDAELAKIVESITVYARVSPEHKVRIVRELQGRGHIVAMTGDGVNDAPALKSADIGVAMGLAGTDVAKEASAMILQDDNFATIVAAIKQGRVIYDNIKKFVRYLLSSNVAEVLIIFLAALIGLPLPLIAVQLLWVNLVTDGMPAVALAVDPPDPDVMKRKPRVREEKPIDSEMWSYIILVSTVITVGTLFVFNWLLKSGASLNEARTAAFTTLMMFEMFNVYNSRSGRLSAFTLKTNKWLHLAVFSSIALQLAVVYIPQLDFLFDTVPLSLKTLGLIIGVAATVLLLVEIRKLFQK